MKPNIFHFATSELSQDAFLFWLLLHTNISDDDSKARNLARNFLDDIFNHEFAKCFKKPIDYTSYNIKPFKQFLNIDILLFFESIQENNQFLLLIEDKVYANESRETQVKYYMSLISESEKFKSVPILPIYFKTGYTSHKEIDYIKNSNIIYYGIEQIDSLLNGINQSLNSDVILDSWILHFKECFEPIIEAKICNINFFDSYNTIYKNIFQNISDELFFTRLTDYLFYEIKKDYIVECYQVQGIGHIDWHYSISKSLWSNQSKDISIALYFVWDGNYSLKLKTSTYEYKPLKYLTEKELNIYRENQSVLKAKILNELGDSWQVTNYPLQIAKLALSGDESISSSKIYLNEQIKKISLIVDSISL
jgi:hypothetical protein